MNFDYTVKTMEEIIGYWIESVHIMSALDALVEYTDEAAEIYETAEWLTNDYKKDASLNSLRDSIEAPAFQARKIADDAEDKLVSIIESAIFAEAKNFAKYDIDDFHNNKTEIMDVLMESFDAIYEYNQESQIKNFYRILFRTMDEVLDQRDI